MKTQQKLRELEIKYQNAVYICISWYKKSADFGWENADFSRTHGVYHVIHIFFRFSLDKT